MPGNDGGILTGQQIGQDLEWSTLLISLGIFGSVFFM